MIIRWNVPLCHTAISPHRDLEGIQKIRLVTDHNNLNCPQGLLEKCFEGAPAVLDARDLGLNGHDLAVFGGAVQVPNLETVLVGTAGDLGNNGIINEGVPRAMSLGFDEPDIGVVLSIGRTLDLEPADLLFHTRCPLEHDAGFFRISVQVVKGNATKDKGCQDQGQQNGFDCVHSG